MTVPVPGEVWTSHMCPSYYAIHNSKCLTFHWFTIFLFSGLFIESTLPCMWLNIVTLLSYVHLASFTDWADCVIYKWLGKAKHISKNWVLPDVNSSPDYNNWGGRSSLCGSSLEVTAKEAVFLGLRSWVTLPSSHEDKLRTMKTLRELSCSSLLFKICVCIFIKPSTMGYSVRKNIMIPREANSPCRHQFSPASTMGSKPDTGTYKSCIICLCWVT